MTRAMLTRILVFTSAAIPFAAGATDYQCSNGNMERRIEIMSEPGVTVPCEVHYFKDTEAPGQHRVLWSAQAEAGYCEARADELAERLRSHGWQCAAKGKAAAARPAQPATPAEPSGTGGPAQRAQPATPAEPARQTETGTQAKPDKPEKPEKPEKTPPGQTDDTEHLLPGND